MVLSAKAESGKKHYSASVKQPVSSKPDAKEKRNGSGKRKRKDISDEEDGEEEPRKNRGKQKAKGSKKSRGARGKAKYDEEEDASEDADESSDGEAYRQKKRKKKPGTRCTTCGCDPVLSSQRPSLKKWGHSRLLFKLCNRGCVETVPVSPQGIS